MRIAIFTNNYLPNPFGVSMSIESFRKEFEKNGHTVYIFAPRFKGYIDTNERVYRYPAIDLNFKGIHFPIVIPFSYRIGRILKNLDIDIVHCQHPNLLGWEGKRWAKKKNVPLVFTWHTLYDKYAHFTPIIPEKIAAWWAIGNAKNFANAADLVITPTPSVQKIIRSWGVTNENILSIPSGVLESEFEKADRQKAREEFEIADDEIVLTLVCRMTAEKNVMFLAEAILKVLQKNEKTVFVVAGDGSELEKFKKIFNDAGVGKRLRCFGIVDGQMKAQVYALSDIFVYASKSETQGMIISEAMFSGLPIVAVSATGVKDLVANQITGLLVKENAEEFAQAVLRLAKNPELRKTFSENSSKIARENYTAKVCAEKMLAAYEKEIERKTNGSL